MVNAIIEVYNRLRKSRKKRQIPNSYVNDTFAIADGNCIEFQHALSGEVVAKKVKKKLQITSRRSRDRSNRKLSKG